MTPLLSGTGLQIAFGLLSGILINWLADTLPYLSKGAPRELGRTISSSWLLLRSWQRLRSWLVVMACMAIFVHGGDVAIQASDLKIQVIGIARSLFLLVFLLIGVIDMEHRRVLNMVLVPTAVLGLVVALAQSPQVFLGALAGAATGLSLFLAIALLRPGEMGGGDVKLAALIGLLSGIPMVFVALAVGILAGGIAALMILFLGNAGRKSTMAYAPYLSLGACIALLYGTQIATWYAQRWLG